MKPKFSSIESWQQAEILMQPVFIRLIDNIRKKLETSEWTGSYQNVQNWPEEINIEQQEHVQRLQEQLSEAGIEEIPRIQEELDKLPKPIPGYELHLQNGKDHNLVDVWELCYRICFQNYAVIKQNSKIPADIDLNLIDDSGEVNWKLLDEKAMHIVDEIFATLPNAVVNK